MHWSSIWGSRWKVYGLMGSCEWLSSLLSGWRKKNLKTMDKQVCGMVLWEWEVSVKILMFYVSIHQRVLTMEDTCNNRVNRRTPPTDASPLQTRTTPELAHRIHEQDRCGGGQEARHGPNMGFNSPRLIQLLLLLNQPASNRAQPWTPNMAPSFRHQPAILERNGSLHWN